MHLASAAIRFTPRLTLAACLAALLTACGGDDGDAAGSTPYAIGGTVAGLAEGAALVLSNNGGDALRVTANGAFTFAQPASGYRIEVATQPSGQNCTVANGSGTAAAPVTDVQVSCAAGDGGGGTGPVITAGIPGILGEWQQGTCVAAGPGRWARNYLRPVQVNETTIAHVQGLRLFADSQCAGAASVLGGTAMGQVTFSRSESNASVAANWGTFKQITGLASQAIWAKRGENTLCLLGDENPSILPTLARVAAALETLPASACYTRL
ncbi:MAG: hypothetical protein QM772_09465 [Ottowia sp.]|uniref:hypothetical protein n=1 Tax=Ottowia sp. TaxID=1898956 RepID=UPI0039E558B2